MMPRLSDGIGRLSESIGRMVRWLSLAMIIVGAFNALARYLDRWTGLGLSSNTWLELQWYMFAALFLLGSSYALRNNAHVRVDVFYHRLSPRGRAWIDLLGTLFLLLPFCSLVIVVSYEAALTSWGVGEVSPDPGGLPRYPLRALVPISFALLALQGIALALQSLARIRGEKIETEGDDEMEEKR